MKIPRALLISAALVSPVFGGNVAFSGSHPTDSWEFTLESGYLWNVGNNTDIDYEIVPTQLTFRSPTMWTWYDGADGAKLVVRNRFSAMFEGITVGPEDYYIGVSAAPSIEYWFPSQKTSIFFSIGGGVGWINSAGGEQGQGQDFTFNWFSQLGVRQEIAARTSVLAGVYFVHHSNGGQTDPNPGIDALGFTVGVGWQF
ncbi:MAG: acyloxyacyl hydrolase [Luteolibacter sp.]